MDVVFQDVGIGCPDHEGLFFLIDKDLGLPEIQGTPCFNFYDHKVVAMICNKVYLIFVVAPVLFTDGKTFVNKVFAGMFFPALA